MSEPLLRLATPTGAPSKGDNTRSEGRADPHGMHWTRGAPPIDFASLVSPSSVDLVALSLSRHTDSTSDGKGSGRRATGFLILVGGTVTVITGAGQSESFQGALLPQGFSMAGEITVITSTGTVLVTW